MKNLVPKIPYTGEVYIYRNRPAVLESLGVDAQGLVLAEVRQYVKYKNRYEAVGLTITDIGEWRNNRGEAQGKLRSGLAAFFLGKIRRYNDEYQISL